MNFNRVFVTGDTHGDFDWLGEWCHNNNTTREDALIILGDAGILFRGHRNEREKALKKYLSQQTITILCVRGNHEQRPTNYPTMRYVEIGTDPVIPDRLYYEDECPNVMYFTDGGVYHINGESFLVIGGAYSVDKEYRLMRGWSWFYDEELTQEEFCNIADKVDHHKYNYVLTHTCPYDWMPTDLFLRGIDQSKISNHTENWLTTISEIVDYDMWLFGHFHVTRFGMGTDGKGVMLGTDVFELNDIVNMNKWEEK